MGFKEVGQAPTTEEYAGFRISPPFGATTPQTMSADLVFRQMSSPIPLEESPLEHRANAASASWNRARNVRALGGVIVLVGLILLGVGLGSYAKLFYPGLGVSCGGAVIVLLSGHRMKVYSAQLQKIHRGLDYSGLIPAAPASPNFTTS